MQNKFLFAGALASILLMGASCQKAVENPTVNMPTNEEKPAVTANVNANINADVNTNASVNSNTNSNTNTATPVAPKPTEPVANVNQSVIETKTFNIEMTRFSFTPSTLNVGVGDTVVINATSKDTTHGISIPEFSVNLIVPKGSTQTTSFVANKAGTYKFRCSVYCGEGHSDMTGTLIVK